MAKQTPLVVLSSGRAGSTLLARMIHGHPELLCVSDLFEPVGDEPHFDRSTRVTGGKFFRIRSRPSYPQRIAYWRQQPTAELLFLPEEDELVSLLLSYTLPFLAPEDPLGLFAEIRQAVEAFPEDSVANVRLFEWLRDRFGKRLWVERPGGSLPHAQRIIDTWPEGRYVHNFRDPRETAISMLKGSFFRLYLELERNPQLERWDRQRHPPVEQLSEMLNRWVMAALAALDALPAERRLDLPYEHLLAEPEEALLELNGFLQQRPRPTAADRSWARRQVATVRQVSPRFPRLDAATARRLESACAESLEALGYG